MIHAIRVAILKSAFPCNQVRGLVDILAAVKRTAIPHHATFLEWSRQWG
ncbi:hypothetical protein [Microcystis sp. M087S2]|nr:hypothetical protein [Microcystis sp. M087S2]MCA2642379.1 hypothetical protein [Microcystis sp. M087S2]MCA6541610.1 hypothetical protein [Pseudanabaena sp. M037S2SP2A07QC]MCA6566659.1 hypothetical protein [Pseudanabaena sp. M151S2SP2A07QC]